MRSLRPDRLPPITHRRRIPSRKTHRRNTTPVYRRNNDRCLTPCSPLNPRNPHPDQPTQDSQRSLQTTLHINTHEHRQISSKSQHLTQAYLPHRHRNRYSMPLPCGRSCGPACGSGGKPPLPPAPLGGSRRSAVLGLRLTVSVTRRCQPPRGHAPRLVSGLPFYPSNSAGV